MGTTAKQKLLTLQIKSAFSEAFENIKQGSIPQQPEVLQIKSLQRTLQSRTNRIHEWLANTEDQP